MDQYFHALESNYKKVQLSLQRFISGDWFTHGERDQV